MSHSITASTTEPHANEAESIPLTGPVRGAPITGGTVDSRKQAMPPPVIPPPLLRLISTSNDPGCPPGADEKHRTCESFLHH